MLAKDHPLIQAVLKLARDENEIASLVLLDLDSVDEAYSKFPTMARREVRRMWAGRERIRARLSKNPELAPLLSQKLWDVPLGEAVSDEELPKRE